MWATHGEGCVRCVLPALESFGGQAIQYPIFMHEDRLRCPIHAVQLSPTRLDSGTAPTHSLGSRGYMIRTVCTVCMTSTPGGWQEANRKWACTTPLPLRSGTLPLFVLDRFARVSPCGTAAGSVGLARLASKWRAC